MEAIERTPVSERSNLAHWFAGRVHQVLDEVMGIDPTDPASTPVVCVASLSPAQAAETLLELAKARARIEGLEAMVLGHADSVDVAAESGATSTAAWYAHATQTTRGDANRAVKLAKRLDGPDHEATGTALLTGAVDADRARVVVDAVDALPSYVGPEDRQHAEAHLVKEATRHNSKDLHRLGKHLHHVIDPDAADTELAKRLDAEERDA
ncbi:MAG TPA: DUF222 domain-containing protein, partial [Marmoricola sp.]|nr:DUF222 domain-containing protein [Marmoricola sp.]